MTFADWERVSIHDVGQIIKFSVSAYRDGDPDLTDWYEANLTKDQIGSVLFQWLLDVSDAISDTLAISDEYAVEATE
ncbi:MAG: hypothetical protein WBB85_09960 [Albidovulum sp.]